MRKNGIILLLILITLLSGCAISQKEQSMNNLILESKPIPPADFVPKNLSIVAVGDSLTEGVGDINEAGGYIPYLEKHLEKEKGIKKVEFDNFGVKGNRANQLLARLEQDHIKLSIKEADLIIITIGGNDVMKVFKDNISYLQLDKFANAEIIYKDDLTEILNTITSYNSETEILLVGIYNPFFKWFSDIKEVDQIIMSWNNTSKEVVSNYEQVSFISVDDIFKETEENLLHTDFFHPNNKGYELIAERIYDEIKRQGVLDKILK